MFPEWNDTQQVDTLARPGVVFRGWPTLRGTDREKIYLTCGRQPSQIEVPAFDLLFLPISPAATALLSGTLFLFPTSAFQIS